MKYKIVLILTIVFFLQIQKILAQDYFYDNKSYSATVMYEGGGSLGIMNCLTDLGGKSGLGKSFLKDLNFGNNQINGSLYFGITYKEIFGVRLEGSYGQVKSYDSILKDNRESTNGRYERNLSFESKIAEIAILAEFYPTTLILNHAHLIFTPYLIGGIGLFSFNPQTTLNGRTVNLQPLHTEGQGFTEYPDRNPYKLTQINIPVGLGFLYEVSPKCNMRAEFLYRILHTDYLDDVSKNYIDPTLFSKYLSGAQLSDALALNDRRNKNDPNFPINTYGGQIRGTPKRNDAYFTFNIKVGYTFGREKRK